MGMYLGLTTLTDANLDKVLKTPELIYQILDPDNANLYLHEPTKNKTLSFFARLLGYLSHSQAGDCEQETTSVSEQETERTPLLEYQEGERLDIDLDKSWHGIHYLLTQTAWEGTPPLNFILCGGKEVEDIDMGYGSPRIFYSDDVRKINNALTDIDHEYLRQRFNPKDMTEKDIYPSGIWASPPDEDDTLGYCLEYFDVLKAFIKNAAKHHMGLVLYLM